MTDMDEIPHTAIRNKLGIVAQSLMAALDTNDPQQVIPMQQFFTQAAEKAWELVDELAKTPREKAMPRIFVQWAQTELPELAKDPARYDEIRHELKMMQNTMAILFD